MLAKHCGRAGTRRDAARLVMRLQDFVRSGGLWTSDAVQDATMENQAEQDVVLEFIHTMCDVDADQPDSHVTAQALFKEYVAWSKLNQYDTLTSNKFGRRVTDLGFPSARKKINGRTIVVRQGLRLAQEPSQY